MRTGYRVALILALVTVPAAVRAQEIKLEAFGDVRVVRGGDEKSWRDGGLGKLRYGSHDIEPALGELSGIGRIQLLPELSAYAHARIDTEQRSVVDLVEAYFKYRPVSTTPLRWTFKAGAFFPPISLENDGIGWTTPWTLTPSAINSWVGEELRTIGGEATAEWRDERFTVEATAALFGVNDPAGTLIAEHGWTFGDRPIGLFDRSRLPNATLRAGMRGPIYTMPMQEIDGRVGWYTGLAGNLHGVGRISLLYYDNSADGSAVAGGELGWRTDFWAAGFETEIDAIVIKAQLMVGATDFAPGGRRSHTDFEAAYLLVGHDWGEWRLAGRVDGFKTSGNPPRGTTSWGEQGYAGTVSLSWIPQPWVRVIGEVLHVDSIRDQRSIDRIPNRSRDTQVQLAFRLFY